MRVSVSWLAEHLGGELPSDPESIAEAFVRVGLEVEAVHAPPEITGPLVIGRVLDIEELTEFKKPIRFVRVDDGGPEPRGVICGATNFGVGDLVVVARPGTTLPGDFAITARPSYGRISDGMICSLRELGLGAEHTGILVLPAVDARAGRRRAPAARARRPDLRAGDHPGPRLLLLGARAGPRARRRARPAVHRPRAQPRHPARGRRGVAGEDRGRRRLPPLRGPPGDRCRPDAAEPVVDAAPAARRRPAADLARGGRDELRDAAARAAAARVRRRETGRRDRGPRARSPASGWSPWTAPSGRSTRTTC